MGFGIRANDYSRYRILAMRENEFPKNKTKINQTKVFAIAINVYYYFASPNNPSHA